MRIRREPTDDDLHPIDPDPTYNESRYYSFFEHGDDGELGGWIRMGNRPNEGHAELSVCLYLPDGSVAFAFKRPSITGNLAHDAGGLRFEMLEPFHRHRVTYHGSLCVLVEPRQMIDPKVALTTNPHVPCTIELDLVAVADPTGGEPEWEPGDEVITNHFARGHTEQQMAVSGTVTVGDRRFAVRSGLGLRDHSWGPRLWQSVPWYRWITASFDGLSIACAVRSTEGSAPLHISGHVSDVARYGDGRNVAVRNVDLVSDYDDEWFPLRSRLVVTTDDATYTLDGEIRSAIPLRNRRGGKVTRITENVTRWNWAGQRGAGMSEYLDQIIDGRPIGVDAGG